MLAARLPLSCDAARNGGAETRGRTILEPTQDQLIYNVLAGVLTVLLVAVGLWALLRRLSRGRPGFAIGVPIATAVALRMFVAGGINLTSIGAELRGGDEILFQSQAQSIAASPLFSGDWISALTGELHKFVLAVQMWAFDSTEFVLRLGEVGITVVGLIFLCAAVYELVGPRAAVFAAWLLALEPSGVFFSSLLHKEATMFVAEGLVAFGGARMWKRGDLSSMLILALGCLVGIATRPYAGWFLIAASAAIMLHAGLRTTRRNEVGSLGLIAVVVLVAAIFAPVVLEASSDESLEQNLQASQDANAESESDANLALERVDFSTREEVITNLPIRIFDITFKPFVWQLGSASQRLGAIGGLFALGVLAVLINSLWRRFGHVFARAGPLVYLGFFLICAYALSTGNAGTGFRYRTHLIAVALCIIAALWVWRTERATRPSFSWTPDQARGAYGASPRGASTLSALKLRK
jgi:Dolichyl-phosphate-mannose-protein mannosyltransferase